MADESVAAPELRKTPLFDRHQTLGARLVPFAGWLMPIQYEGIVAEHEAVRNRAGLFDVSHMGELRFTGPGALELVDGLVANDLRRIEPGRAVYTCACSEAGTILDDLIVYPRSAEDLLIVCNASNRDKMARHFGQAAAHAPQVTYTDESDRTALLALQGPRALAILDAAGSSLAPTADRLGTFRFAEATVAGRPVTLARTGYTGEDGVELFCSWDDAPKLWDALLEAGQGQGIRPVGLGARDTLRLEARLSLYGNEIDETTNPLEAGLGWSVKLDAGEFLGRQALLDVQQRGLTRKLVGFEMTGRGVARHGYPLLSLEGQVVGVCTSGGPAPTLGKNIGLGYLPVELTEVGTEFLVDCRGKHVPAVVVKTPFYKRPRTG
ncbi:MAG: glycine cleavage system aminomethyltransferase GcvT [Myxococcales bacterium]|nr:glycine cleavage system aminomethyltransferase GcvT [Myxococcales bacterium]